MRVAALLRPDPLGKLSGLLSALGGRLGKRRRPHFGSGLRPWQQMSRWSFQRYKHNFTLPCRRA